MLIHGHHPFVITKINVGSLLLTTLQTLNFTSYFTDILFLSQDPIQVSTLPLGFKKKKFF